MTGLLIRLLSSAAVATGTTIIVLTYGIFEWWVIAIGIALLGAGVYGLILAKKR